jgi:methionine-rich copper-binding protein CopC
MVRYLIALILTGLTTAPVFGQDFTITSTTPTNGAAAVAIQSRVTVTFSEELQFDEQQPDGLFFVEPADSIQFENISLSQDGKSLELDVAHTANTDFVWVFQDLVSVSGKVLDNAYVLNYTTASEAGANTVSGTVSPATQTKAMEVNRSFMVDFSKEAVQRLAQRTHSKDSKLISNGASPVNPKSYSAAPNGNVTALQSDGTLNNTVVFLLDNNLLANQNMDGESEDPIIRAGAVVDPANGSYSMDFVRDGTYWPFTVKLNFGDEDFPYELGFYDPDGDGEPNSLEVAGSDADNIDMTLYDFAPFTAAEGMDKAINAVTAIESDAELKVMSSFEQHSFDMMPPGGMGPQQKAKEMSPELPDLKGKSQMWQYFFYTPSKDQILGAFVNPLGVAKIDTLPKEQLPSDVDFTQMESIPSSFVDSDVAAHKADSIAGKDFRQAVPYPAFLATGFEGGHIYWEYPEDQTSSAPNYWRFDYYRSYFAPASQQFFSDSISVYLDIETGEALGVYPQESHPDSTFEVTSATPADGSVDIGVDTTITIAFSAPLSAQSVYEGSVMILPMDSVEVQSVIFAEDLRSFDMQVHLTDNTDFRVNVSDVTSQTGQTLPNGYNFAFSTGSDLGQWALSGAVNYHTGAAKVNGAESAHSESVDAESLDGAFASFGNAAVERWKTNLDQIGAWYSNATQEMQQSTLATQNENQLEKSMVFLLKGNPFTGNGEISPDSLMIGSTLTDADGAYQFDYLRNGTYWLLAAHDGDGNGRINPESEPDYVGFYDADDDGEIDSVKIEDADVSGVDMSLYQQMPFLAAQGFGKAETAAAEFGNNARWIAAFSEPQGSKGTPDGRRFNWNYVFHLEGQTDGEGNPKVAVISVAPEPFGVIAKADSLPEMPPGLDITQMNTIPDPAGSDFIDTDEAFRIAEENGGLGFRQKYEGRDDVDFHNFVVGGHLYSIYPYDQSTSAPIYWQLEYRAYTYSDNPRKVESNSNQDSLIVYVNMETGEFLGKEGSTYTAIESDGPNTLPKAFALGENYPNPFNPTTIIPFSLKEAVTVNLSVFNIIGQRVATLVNERLPAGNHSVSWDATSMPSGTYIYRIEAGDFVESRKLILLK